MKKVKFIYNPFSGNNKIIDEIDNIIGVYQKYGYQIVPFRISYESKLEDAFSDLNDGSWDHLLLAGGDGSISQGIDMLKKKDIDLPVGILPTGTANDFAKCIGMPNGIVEACEQILNSEPKKVDLGEANGKYFINVLSFGLFTEVSQNTPSNLKNTVGKLAYFLNGIKELPKFKKLKVVIEADEYSYIGDSFIVFVFNGKTAGNIKIAYKSIIDDGMLDVIIVKANLMNTTKNFFNFILKNHLEDFNEGITHFRTKKLLIDCVEEVGVDIDGEKGPKFPLQITCIEDGINVLGYKEIEPKQIEKFINNLKANLPQK